MKKLNVLLLLIGIVSGPIFGMEDYYRPRKDFEKKLYRQKLVSENHAITLKNKKQEQVEDVDIFSAVYVQNLARKISSVKDADLCTIEIGATYSDNKFHSQHSLTPRTVQGHTAITPSPQQCLIDLGHVIDDVYKHTAKEKDKKYKPLLKHQYNKGLLTGILSTSFVFGVAGLCTWYKWFRK